MSVSVGSISIGGMNPLVLIAGPCVVESREMVLSTAREISLIAKRHATPWIFKSSYRKANRTSGDAFTGLDPEKALAILDEVRKEVGVPVLTDIHTAEEAPIAAEVADVLQIPAFLCRQTTLIQAAAKTGRVVNIKKGQFLAPEDMKHAVKKVTDAGNSKVILTERGTTFGYHNLVVDMRSLVIMKEFGPVVFDATHSVQLPGSESSGATGGQPEFVFPLARAGVAAGCDGLFVEVHPDPARARSDAGSQLKLEYLESLLRDVTAIDRIVRKS